MGGPFDCNDEATKDVKCCGCFKSYTSFKVLAWIQVVEMSMAMYLTAQNIVKAVLIAKAAAAARAATGLAEMGDVGSIPSVGDVGSIPSVPSMDIGGLSAPPAPLSTLVFLFAVLLFCVVAPFMFVFCDSATSRKIHAISIALSGLAMLFPQANLTQIIYSVVKLYFAHEMNKLVDFAGKSEGSFTAL